MIHELKVIRLCTYSRATGGVYDDDKGTSAGFRFRHRGECPLGLNTTEHQACGCKVNARAAITSDGHSTRVACSAYPFLGKARDPIRDEKSYAAWVKRKAKAVRRR